jgi:hypothetical protein
MFSFYFKTRYKLTFLFLFIFIQNTLFAQLRKYSNEFMSIGVGAENLATGNSCIATINGVNAGYWNPAGLVNSNLNSNVQGALMHSEYFAGLSKYDYIGLYKKIDSVSSVGFSAIRLGIDDIPNTLDLIDQNGTIDFNRISRFSAADYGFLVSYSRKTKVKGLSIGSNAKVIHRRIGTFARANGFGLDAALQYKKDKWSFGVMMRDVTTTFNSWKFSLTETEKEVLSKTDNILPTNSLEITAPKLIVGVAYTYTRKFLKAHFETALVNTFNGQQNTLLSSKFLNIDPSLGVQLSYAETIWLRAGLNNIQTVREFNSKITRVVQPNIGAGFKINFNNFGHIYIDYALSNVNQQVGLLSHVFSIRTDVLSK